MLGMTRRRSDYRSAFSVPPTGGEVRFASSLLTARESAAGSRNDAPPDPEAVRGADR